MNKDHRDRLCAEMRERFQPELLKFGSGSLQAQFIEVCSDLDAAERDRDAWKTCATAHLIHGLQENQNGDALAKAMQERDSYLSELKRVWRIINPVTPCEHPSVDLSTDVVPAVTRVLADLRKMLSDAESRVGKCSEECKPVIEAHRRQIERVSRVVESAADSLATLAKGLRR